MRHIVLAVCVAALLPATISFPASAQTVPKRSPEEMRASYDAHKGDFDYLLGDWEFTADSKEYGKFRGLWSAVRLDGGQILDEYRIVDDRGDTMYMTTSLRNYNGALDRWELVSVGEGNGLKDMGTGRRAGAEMHIEQTFGVTTDKPSLWKIRYYDIGPDRFSWSADRSTDAGKTWVTKHQTIEAQRVGPPRSLGAIAKGKTPTQAASQPTDPISGNWGADGQTFLELKLDAGNAVSGTVIWRDGPSQESRAPIKTGTFDPKTGAVKLEGEAKRPDTGATANYAIEGKLEKATLAGTFVFDDRKGNFTFTRK
jgi:hypothetical protein